MSQFVWTGRHITRKYVREHRELTFLFGDNAEHVGMGGMAAEMRGESNCIGVPTKWKPDMNPNGSFFSDSPAVSNRAKQLIEDALAIAERRGQTIVVPVGIGAGRAQMPSRCPKLYSWLCQRLGKPQD